MLDPATDAAPLTAAHGPLGTARDEFTRIHRAFMSSRGFGRYASAMEWWGWALIALGALALVALAHRLGWIDLSDKSRRGGGGPGVLGIGDEVFHPTRHEAQVELDRQTSLPAPAPVPGDGPLGIVDAPAEEHGYAGRLRIQVD